MSRSLAIQRLAELGVGLYAMLCGKACLAMTRPPTQHQKLCQGMWI